MSNITLATMCAFAFSLLSAQDVSSTDFQKQIMSISVDTSIMRALTSVGNDRRIAIGILLGTGSPHQLCEVKRQVTIRDRPISEFMDELLTKSNYVWSVTDGVIVVRPSHITNQLNRLRNLKFDRFGGMQTTMQGLGIALRA